MFVVSVILQEAMAMAVIVLLLGMHVLVSVFVAVIVVRPLLSAEHGDLATPDEEVGLGQDEEDTGGK